MKKKILNKKTDAKKEYGFPNDDLKLNKTKKRKLKQKTKK